MSAPNGSGREPSGISTLDLLLFTAGFACGWVMHQGSALRAGLHFTQPFSRGGFRSLLGMVSLGWLWAFAVGLAFLAVGRCFRYDHRLRPAEWLTVALALVLFVSVYPSFRTDRAGSMIGETAWIQPGADSEIVDPVTPVMYDLWWPKPGESLVELSSNACRLAAAALTIAIIGWRLRARLSPGWVVMLLIAIAVLLTLGPIRLAEATSIDVSSSAPNPAYQPRAGEKPWSWPAVAAYYDARAWAGYSLRALALLTLAMLAVRSLLTRWKDWLWTEWAAFATALIIAGCWIYDEFVARPALDPTVRAVFLCTWVLALAVMAGGAIWVWSRVWRRFTPG
jgi:hypothetical protein